MAQAPANSAAAQASQNHAMRQALVASGVRARKLLGILTGTIAANPTVRQKLFNVGVITNLMIDVTENVTIGTANAVLSLKGPYNFLSRVRVTDYDGTDRVNLSGYQLYVLNCKRNKTLYGQQNSAAGTTVLVNPAYPVTTGARAVQFILDIPIAFDADNPIVELIDLRGAIMAQTAVGEMYLSIDINPSLVSTAGDIDSLYSGSGTTTVVDNGGFSISVYQDYILPQTPPGANAPPLPLIDLMTVYECVGNVKSNDNIAVNTPKIMSYPNARSVVGAFYNYVTGGSAAMGNMSTLQLVANGNNVLLYNTERTQIFGQRKRLDADIGPGVYFNNHSDHPVETALFGNIQEYLTPAVVSGGNQYIEYAYESFFLKGQALPGFNQAS